MELQTWLAWEDKVIHLGGGITLGLCNPPKAKYVQSLLRRIDAAGMDMVVMIDIDEDSYHAHDNGCITWGDIAVHLPDPDFDALQAIYDEMCCTAIAQIAMEGYQDVFDDGVTCDNYSEYVALINAPKFIKLIDEHVLTDEEAHAMFDVTVETIFAEDEEEKKQAFLDEHERW